jgi:hypothetical protein
MVKRNEWIRKKLKREKKKQDKGIVDLMMIMNHFFKHLREWIEEMTDPRHSSYITYTQSDLVYMGLLKNMCGVKSMYEMESQFNEETCIDTLRIISGDSCLTEMPHSDTLNYYLERLSPECLHELRKKMIKNLIRMKSFGRARLLGKYWRIILDGTGLFYFKEKHCDNCLVKTVVTEDGKKVKTYYHKVLEAKLVLGEKIIISIDTEFIENESETVSKQDCEITAAKRLMERLAKDYPRLPVCIQGDNLYAVESIMKICKNKNWHYIFTHKDSRQKLLGESYEWIKQGGGATVVMNICGEKGTGEFANHVDETAGKEETANIFGYAYEVEKDGKKQTISFSWLTDIELTKKNLEEMIIAGRGRWKIENEGFNSQKNGIYDIEHLNSRNTNAMKNHYLLTQVADIIMQLYLAWNPLRKEIKQTIKNTSSRLLESFRRQTVTDEDVSYTERYTTVYLE